MKKGEVMLAYVVKTWEVGTQPNENGNYVEIQGRTPGLFSWFLALMGIEPTVAIRISDKVYTLESGSLSGRFYKTIPIAKISSVYYGFAKPWKETIFLFIILAFILTAAMRTAGSNINLFGAIVISLAVSTIIALLYYSLNKKLTLGVFEVGGKAIGIVIKRSIIEGKKLGEKDAEQVGDLVKQLLELKN
jgi:hypothetical protein